MDSKSCFDKVEIKYNPYSVDTQIIINDSEISDDSRLKYIKNKRLQHYISENKDWKGFISEIYNLINDNKIEIIFKGRAIDFEDLEDSIELFREDNPRVEIKLELKEFFSDDEILEKVKKFYEDIQAGPMEELKTKDIKESFKNALESEFRVSLIATMSSGKSTLINSMIGRHLLPAQNESCTAKITVIKDVKNSYDSEFYITGSDKEVADSILLKKLNKENNDEIVKIEGPIMGISSKNMQLVLLDTPGPNNHADKTHGEITQTIIDDTEKNMVMYILNPPIVNDDDAVLLKNISKHMKNHKDKQSKDRFIFVVNRCDTWDTDEEGPISVLVKEVEKYLLRYGIYEPNIFPVSAKLAKVMRMSQQGITLNINQEDFFENRKKYIKYEVLHFEKYASLTESVKKILMRRLEEAQSNDDDLEQVLIHSGVPALEETINEYLDKYAYPIKIKKAIDSFERKLKELEMLRNLEENMAKSKEDFEKIKKEIEILEFKKNDCLDAQRIKEKISELNIDNTNWNHIDKEAIDFFNKIGEEIDNLKEEDKKNKIKVTYINDLVNKFKESINKVEEGVEYNIQKEFEKIRITGHKILNEYNIKVNKVFKELSFKDFNIANMDSVAKTLIDENELESIIEENRTTEYNTRDELIWRKWYSVLRLFGKDYYFKEVKVLEEYVESEPIIESLATKPYAEMEKRVNMSKKHCELQLAGIKNEFYIRLDCLDKAIKDVINILKEKNKNYENSKDIFESKEKQYRWLKTTLETFDNIVNMKEGL